jgi:hypothetical protein
MREYFSDATLEELREILNLVDYLDSDYINWVTKWAAGEVALIPNYADGGFGSAARWVINDIKMRHELDRQ